MTPQVMSDTLFVLAQQHPTDARLHAVAKEFRNFITRRLTEAARLGTCHHCDEQPTPQPCWWCHLLSVHDGDATP